MMENRKVKLSIDYGNSETRIMLSFTDNEGIDRNILSRIDNTFLEWNRSPKLLLRELKDYSEDTTYIIDVSGKKIISGAMAIATSPAYTIRPTSSIKKYANETTKWSTQNVFIRAIEILKNVLGEDINTLIEYIEWSLNISLPAQEVLLGEDEIITLFKDFTLSTFYPKMNGKLKINSVNVIPEGFASVLASAYTVDGEDKNREFGKQNTLVIDIGDGTTDLLVCQGLQLKYNTLKTINYGGSNIKKKLENMLIEEEAWVNGFGDYFYNDILKNNGIYYTTKGNELNFSSQLQCVIQEVSRGLTSQLDSYFVGCDVILKNIECVLFVGGGSINHSENSVYAIIKNYLIDNYGANESLFVEPPILEDIEYFDVEDGLIDEIPEDQIRFLNVVGNNLASI